MQRCSKPHFSIDFIKVVIGIYNFFFGDCGSLKLAA